MSRLRNPFRMRASEKIVSDANFLGMYSHNMLDLLSKNHNESKLWENVTYIHSSPGGGKTSLLRLFEPSVLNSLYASQTYNKELYGCLEKLEVFKNEKIDLLGVYLLCSRSFEMVEDIASTSTPQKRLFFCLLNSRIILATLKNILYLKNKRFPEDLSKVEFNYKDTNNYFINLNTPCTGKELYEWAANSEEKIFNALDSLVPIKESMLPGHHELFSFIAMQPQNFTFEGCPICDKFLFMLDDAHILTHKQRGFIQEELIAKRGTYSVWIAERIEVLEPKTILESGNSLQRDYEIINLEEFYRNKETKIAGVFATIADKRARLSVDNLNSFQENLSITIDENKYRDCYQKSINDSQNTFSEFQKSTRKYDLWIEYALTFKGSVQETAIIYKQIEILIHRDVRKQQLSFDFGISKEELTDQLGGEIKNAAIYFISMKYKIPYYYGFLNLAKMSSCNIEQFLSFSSELFECMLSNNLIGNNITLSADEQEKIIKEVALNKWKLLSNGIPYSGMIINFLRNLGAFCKEETNKPNAPYAPGVNGFAIREMKVKNLFELIPWTDNPQFESLMNVISTCVAFNLLEVKKTNQGAKGQIWNVYYLNRWLCVYFQLPLSYGNWRPKNPNELHKWLK